MPTLAIPYFWGQITITAGSNDRIDWAEDAMGKLVVVLAVVATVSLLLTWGSTYLVRKMSERRS